MNKGTPLMYGFNLNAALPLDYRSVVDTIEELLILSNEINPLVCHGQTTYVKETQLFYQYTGNGETGGWEEVCSLEKLKDVINITKEEITVNMENLEEGLRNKINVTAKELESKFSDLSGGDFSSITQDINSIRSEVSALEGRLNSKITQTADTIMLELTNREDGLKSQITATAKELRSEFSSIAGGDYSAIYQDLEGLHAEIEAMNGTLNNKIDITAQGLQADMEDLESGLRSEIELSAKNLESKFAEIAGGDYSSIYQDINTIRTEISAMDSKLTSQIEQTASALRTEMSDMEAGIDSKIELSAKNLEAKFSEIAGGDYSVIYQDLEKIRTEIADVDEKLTSSITETASSIRAEVTDFKSSTESKFTLLSDKIDLSVSNLDGKYTSLQQTVDNLKIEAGDGEAINSKIEQTAADIRTEISNLETDLKSQISQTESSLTLKFDEGYNQGITKINKDGIIVTHSGMSGSTRMASDGFYVNNGVENVISVTSSGSSFKGRVVMTSGTISGTSIIDGGCIATDSLDATKIKSNSITADQIASGAITADQIAAGTITSTELASNSITAQKIQSGAVTADALAANAITGKYISGGTIEGTTVTGVNISGTSISGGTVSGANITGGNISGTSITGASISGNTISGGTISGASITGGTITGSKIIGEGTDNRILINNADYEIQTGGVTKGFYGLRQLDDGYIVPRLSMSTTGLTSYDNYFVMQIYNEDANPQSYAYPYIDLAYRCQGFAGADGHSDFSNLKIYGDGVMRLSPIQKLEITTNYVKGAYKSSGEGLIAQFGSESHDCYDYYLDVRSIRNYQNSNGLVFSFKRDDGLSDNEFNARMMVYNDGFRTFAPFRPTSDGITHHLGSGSYRWQTIYAVNSLNTSSDITLKENIKYLSETPNTKAVRNTELSTQDLYEFVRDDLFLTSYNWKEDEDKDEKLGFIAQDIVDTKVGEKVIVCNRDRDDTLGYDSGNFEAVLAGALQVAIQKIEQLEAKVKELENK